MNCMKCGRDLEQEQVFCDRCLKDMERYPVSPGTVVVLPRHREDYNRRVQPRRKHQPSSEDQLHRLRRKGRWLRFWIALLAAACLVLGGLLVWQMNKEVKFLPGQNYSAMETSTAPAAGEE